jgi:hypothetical protein
MDNLRCGRYRGDDVAIDTDPSWGTAGSSETHWLVHLANVTHAPVDHAGYPSVGSLVAVHRGDHRASLVLRVLHVDTEQDLALTVAVPPQSAFGSVSLRFRVGVPEHVRKRGVNILVNKSAPEPGADPVKFGLYNSPLDMGSTWLGLGVECIECSIAVQPYIEFELDMRLGWREFRMSNVRFFSGSTIDLAQIMRFTVQGAANFISYRIPLAPRIDWGPPTGIPFAIGPVVGTAKPYLVLGASFGAMALGAVDLTLGARMGLGSGLGVGWSEGGGLTMESRVLREPYVTPELDLSVVPTRSNPRIKVYGALQILAGVKLWGLVSPYVAFRAPELSAEWLFKTPGCPGAGYRSSLGLRTFGGISLFPGWGKKHGTDKGNGQRNAVFGELEFTGGLPLELDKLLPSIELASGCIDEDGEADTVINKGALQAQLTQVEEAADAAAPTALEPIGYTNEQPADAATPSLLLPTYEYEAAPLSIDTQINEDGVVDAVHVTSSSSRTLRIEPYVRLCLSSVSVDVTAKLHPIVMADIDSDSISSLVQCPIGTVSTLVAGPAIGIEEGVFDLGPGESTTRPISMNGPLMRYLLANNVFEQRAQLALMEVGADRTLGVSGWRSVAEWTMAVGGPPFSTGAEWLTYGHESEPLMSAWSSCTSKCAPEMQQRTAYCFAGAGCNAVLAPLVEERPCPVYRCPVYPLAWSTVSGSTDLPFDNDIEFLAVEAPAHVSIGWTGGSPFDRFEVDIRVSGCETDDNEVWLPVRATITSADSPDFLDDLELGSDESSWTDGERLDMALGSTSWRAALSIPALALGVQTRLRVRPISTVRDCSDTGRALLSPLLSISSRRLMHVMVFDKDGVVVDPMQQPLFGPGGADLIAVGSAGSVSILGSLGFQTPSPVSSSTGTSWIALDSGRVHTVHLMALDALRAAVPHDRFPLTVTLVAAQTPSSGPTNLYFNPWSAIAPLIESDTAEDGDGYQIRARLVVDYAETDVLLRTSVEYSCSTAGLDSGVYVLAAHPSVSCSVSFDTTTVVPAGDGDLAFSAAAPTDSLVCLPSSVLTFDDANVAFFDQDATTTASFTCDMDTATALRGVNDDTEQEATSLVVVVVVSAAVLLVGACACASLVCLGIVLRRRHRAASTVVDAKSAHHSHAATRSHSRRRSTHSLHHKHRGTSPSPPPPVNV